MGRLGPLSEMMLTHRGHCLVVLPREPVITEAETDVRVASLSSSPLLSSPPYSQRSPLPPRLLYSLINRGFPHEKVDAGPQLQEQSCARSWDGWPPCGDEGPYVSAVLHRVCRRVTHNAPAERRSNVAATSILWVPSVCHDGQEVLQEECATGGTSDVRLQSARFHFPASPDPLDCGAVTFHLLSDRTCFHPGLTNVQLSDVKVERCSGLTSSRLAFSFAGGLSQGSRQNVLVCLEVCWWLPRQHLSCCPFHPHCFRCAWRQRSVGAGQHRFFNKLLGK